MSIKQITSRDNPFFKNLRKLADSARERRKADQTLLDGDHLISAYLDAGGVPQSLILSEDVSPVGTFAKQIAVLDGVQRIVLPPAMFAELSPVKSPGGVMALIDIPAAKVAGQEFCVLLEDIQDPGNLGSILRSAAAAGVQTAYLSKQCADAWSPKVLRGGMGAHFVLSIREQADLSEVVRQLPGALLAASLEAEHSLYDINLTGPVAFAIGNEGAGLSAELSACATEKIRIPMPGTVESLNAAAAAAICFFERVRQQSRKK